jgi:hypothetical protein
MSEDIEKLKEAAFKLAEMHRNQFEEGQAYPVRVWKEAVATIEAFKPKVEPLECWVNLFTDGQLSGPWVTKDKAESQGYINQIDRLAIHLREVAPVEWERWETKGNVVYQKDKLVINASNVGSAVVIANLHNAEMHRVTGTEGK